MFDLRRSYLALLAIWLVLILLAPACAPTQPAANAEESRLKIGLLPIPESLPMWLAERDGYFAAEKVTVELVNFASAVERDAAIQAGQLDGQLNDLVSVGLLNKERATVKVVRQAHQGQPGTPMISLVVGPGSKVQAAADLKGAEIGLSQNTVIEYVVDSLLQAKGIGSTDVKKTEVPKIPLRLEMLAKGQLAAAGLPEPFASLAKEQGGRTILDDGEGKIGQSTIVFRADALSKKSAAIKGFLRAYERAVGDINADAQRFRELLVDKAKVPDAVAQSFKMPPLPKAGVPREGEVKAVFDWMTAKGLLGRTVPYAEVVDASLLPK